ncbi:hypothetical protein LOTGIDRAFT_211528 [Lottia gigantea]|uniref:Dehydrogenase/reductase SDR family member 4 n=1 Tax=Lottia gigantea TaxID=225164 RepID=V3YXT8_LOTGI|nr:hypothetical protein LOTGIDRAFT_211528 [Lottia gigantea]ESO82883.1 hypothetical protein LOTGIDRAFT_211528 [Lottia gigantea]
MASCAGKLLGKVAIVTASTEGIGFAIARRLGQDGAKVMISSRKEDNVKQAVEKLKNEKLEVEGMVCHVGKTNDRSNLVKKTIERFGAIDILVSNAAVNPYFGPMMNIKEEQWDKIFDINVKAAFLLCQEAVPHIAKRGSGSIILVSSVAGYSPLSLLGPYGVSKTALLGLAKAMAPELAQSNIRVNVLAPGIIKTNFSKAIWTNDNVHNQVVKQIPMNRMGEPEDCAGTVSFLASDDSKYITGESILVTGGMTARL